MIDSAIMVFLATECPVAIECIHPKVEYQINPQPVVDAWLAAVIVVALLILAFALGSLRRRI